MSKINSFFLLPLKCKKKNPVCFVLQHTFANCGQRVPFQGLVSKMHQACLDVLLQTCDAAFEDTGGAFTSDDASVKAIFVQVLVNS